MDWSVIGIVFSLAFIVVLALRGWHIIVIAPLAVVIVSILSNMNIMETMNGPYMKGFTNYAGKFYLIFLAGSLFGKFMEDGQAARSIANGILKVTGRDSPMRVMLAVSVVALCLTYGGVSLFVVIFAVLPISRPLFKEMNLAWHLWLAAFIFGGASITMTMLPGSPQIQNIIPTKYMASTTYSAPLVGLTGAVVVIIFNLLYFRYILKKSKERGAAATGPTPNVFLSLVPPIVVLILLNFDIPYLKRDPVIALTGGVLTCIVLFWKYYANIVDSLSKGALNTVVPVVNTCADVGYGMAVAATTGFKLISSWLLAIPGNPVISLAIATNIMAAITGSASGGLGIIMETLVPKYLAMGVNPDLIHRIAAMASGGFDAMPHNGVVITTLAIAGLTHKNAYKHLFFGHVVADTLGLIVALPVGIWIYG